MRTVLFVTYYYPPLNRSAGRRPAALAKYLPETNWNPRVITRNWETSKYLDDAFCEERVMRAVAGKVDGRQGDIYHPGLWDHVISWLEGKRHPAKWVRGAISRAGEIIQQEKIDVILATYPDICSFYVAATLSKKWRMPWVADLQDVAGEHPAEHLPQRLTIWRHIRWETALLKSASSICTVNPGRLQGILEARVKRPVEFIPNGYDPEFFTPGDGERNSQFTLVYTGALGRTTDLSLLGQALDELLAERKLEPQAVRLIFLGTDPNHVRRFFGQERVWPLVEVVPWAPLRVVARAQREATVLLHATYPRVPGMMTAKIYEYLAAQRPILTAPGDSDCVDRLLTQTNAGRICNNLKVAKENLLQLYAEWKGNGIVKFRGSIQEIQKYSYRRLATRISGVLSSAAAC